MAVNYRNLSIIRSKHVSQSTFLHVEDDDASAFLLQTALQRAALFNPLTRVSTGEDALAFLCQAGAYKHAKTPALVILDLNLPRVDGFDVLSIMKSRQHFRSIPVVVMSSSERQADQERALSLGAYRYFVKHDDVAKLAVEIRSLFIGLIDTVTVPLDSDRPPAYKLKKPMIAFECRQDNGMRVNVPLVLAEQSLLEVHQMHDSCLVLGVRHQERDLLVFADDLQKRGHFLGESEVTPPDSPAVPYPSPPL